MQNPVINFFSEKINFTLKNKRKRKAWIIEVAHKEGYLVKEINYVFCSDKYLLEINRAFLQHDYFTDIITFNNSEKKRELEGDIYISISRVKENAGELQIPFEEELNRVMVHGILHLMGYKDKTKQQRETMRTKENNSLKAFV
jgi:probable rRNA maturation factor